MRAKPVESPISGNGRIQTPNTMQGGHTVKTSLTMAQKIFDKVLHYHAFHL